MKVKTASSGSGLLLALVPAFVFAQAAVTAECPDADCHVAPFFKGNGGFVGQFNSEAMADGEPLDSVGIIVTCGNITMTVQAAPADDGRVAHLFNDMNGLACHQDGGEIQIHGLLDGAWYWIHDDVNSAVSNLLPKDALDNVQTAPFDASGGIITMTRADNATLVKDTASGRVGILQHILPAAEPPKCPTRRNGCMLTGEYTVEIKRADGTLVNGTNIERGTEVIPLTATLRETGTVKTGTVLAYYYVNGPDGTKVPDLYGQGIGQDEHGKEGLVLRFGAPGQGIRHESVDLQVPAAVDQSGVILDRVERLEEDPCRSVNQHRDTPITLVVEIGNTENTVPGLPDVPDGSWPVATFSISCPPLVSGG